LRLPYPAVLFTIDKIYQQTQQHPRYEAQPSVGRQGSHLRKTYRYARRQINYI
jgi:hypothetical protein